MLTNIVAHDAENRNVGFESLTSDERAEYDAWAEQANEGTRDPLPIDFVNEQAIYSQAKAVFDTLHPFSRPDSLTRRGNVLIARRRVTVESARNGARQDWRETIERLFKDVEIYSVDIDSKFNLRVRFTPYPDGMLTDDSGWQAWKREASLGHYEGWR